MPQRTRSRNAGLDLLRMVSMAMVVTLHVLLNGVLDSATPLSPDYETAWLLECAAYCAVNCYALLSGYVGLEGRFRYANLAVLWCQVAFYTLLIPLAFAMFRPGTVGLREAVRGFFPVMSGHYWYFTAYFAMFFFIPVFNYLVRHLSRRQMDALAAGIVVVFSLLPTAFQTRVLGIFRNDLFITGEGYSPLWLALLYLLGAYARKYDLFARLSCAASFALYGACVLLTWGEKWAAELLRLRLTGEFTSGGILVSYTSPTILFAAVFLLAGFSKLRLPAWAARAATALSPMAFSVYLIHVHPLVWQYVMMGRFRAFGSYGTVKLAVCVLGAALAIYALCTAIDAVRLGLFRAARLRERLVQLEEKHLKNPWADAS